MANLLQVKRGLKSNIPTLSEGEPGFATDAGEFYVGDGAVNYRFIPGDQYVQTTSDVTFNSLTVTAASDGIDAGSTKIINVADPVDPQDAATKAYTDAIEQGLDLKDSVRVATDGTNIDLTSAIDPGAVDGVTLSNGDRILLKDQSTVSENGIYDAITATDPTSWTRSGDADEDAEVTSGLFTFVEEGTVNNNRGFVLVTTGTITVGTTSLDFTQFSSAGQVTAGDGLTKSGDTLNVELDIEDNGTDVNTGHGLNFSSNMSVTDDGDGTFTISVPNDLTVMSNYSIGDLNNANIATLSAGQLLIYDATNTEFVNAGVTASTGISKTEADGSLTLSTDDANIDHDSLLNYVANEHIDWTIDVSATNTINDANINKTAVTQYTYTYADLSLGIDDTAVNGETTQPITSNWAYDHTNATTGIHGAGANTLLDSSSTVDCGTV